MREFPTNLAATNPFHWNRYHQTYRREVALSELAQSGWDDATPDELQLRETFRADPLNFTVGVMEI